MILKDIVEQLANGQFKLSTASFVKVEAPYETSAQDFYSQSENDLQQEAFVNCISNAKRALDVQINFLLIAFGFNNKLRKSFPEKIELITSIGVVAPRILLKINSVRNMLEHEFKKATKEEAEDFLDITALFLASTDRYVYQFPDSASFRNGDGYQLNFHIRYQTNQMEIIDMQIVLGEQRVNIARYYYGSTENINEHIGDKSLDAKTIILDIRNEEYIPLLKAYLNIVLKR